MVAISVDGLEDSQGLVEKLSLTFPLVSDADRTLTKAFGLFDQGNDIAWPAVFVLGSDGHVAWRSFEDDYKERVPIQEIVSAARAAQ